MKLKVKGINDGLLIVLPEGDWDDCLTSVQETVDEKHDFFAGADLFLEAGSRGDMRVIEITSVRDMLDRYGIHLMGIYGGTQKTIQNCLSLGLMTEPTVTRSSFRKKEIEKKKAIESGTPGDMASIITKNVRSGMSIRRAESIVIIGDVNPGAEIISDNNVIVWGKIRGHVCAGKEGGEPAFVRTFGLEDAQITINGISKFFPKETKRGKSTSSPMTLIPDNGDILTEGK